jgi:hypothetical protein
VQLGDEVGDLVRVELVDGGGAEPGEEAADATR